TRNQHRGEEATKETWAFACRSLGGEAAFCDGVRGVSHGSSPFVGSDDSRVPSLGPTTPGRFQFLIVVERNISASRPIRHALRNIRSVRATNARCRARVAMMCI